MKKNTISVFLILAVSFVLLAGCSGGTKYEDGVYFAQEDGFGERTGWKYMVTINVQNGNIVAADWNGANRDGGPDKKYRSMNGIYPMVANGGAQADWHVQAAKAEEYFLSMKGKAPAMDDSGTTDAISGVSVKVKALFTLAEEALEKR